MSGKYATQLAKSGEELAKIQAKLEAISVKSTCAEEVGKYLQFAAPSHFPLL